MAMIVAGNKTLYMDGEEGIKVMQALGNETRLLILSLLSHRSKWVTMPPNLERFML